MIGQVMLTAVWALMAVVWAFIPIMKGADAFFGVPVSEEYMRGPQGRRYLHTFWLLVALFMGGSIACVWLLPPSTTGIILMDAGVFGVLIAIAVIFCLVRRHQVISPADPVAAVLQPRNRWQYINWPLEGLCLVLIASSWSYFAVSYQNLPAKLVDASGRLTSVGWASLGTQLIMQLYAFVLFLVVMMGMAQSAVRLPVDASDEYLSLRERYMRMMVGLFYALKVTMIVFFGGAVALFLRAAGTGNDRDILVAVVGPMAAYWIVVFGAFAYYAVKMYRLRAHMRALAGPGSLERSADHGGWVAGFIYFNPQDPSIWVEKRIGYGYTVNMARWEAWLILVIFIAPAFLIPWLTSR